MYVVDKYIKRQKYFSSLKDEPLFSQVWMQLPNAIT